MAESAGLEAAVTAAVQAALVPAITAAVTAGAAAAAAPSGGSGGQVLDADALAAALAAAVGAQLEQALQPVVAGLQEVVQVVRSTEGQLVRAVQQSADSAAQDARQLFNSMRTAHNQAQMARQSNSSWKHEAEKQHQERLNVLASVLQL